MNLSSKALLLTVLTICWLGASAGEPASARHDGPVPSPRDNDGRKLASAVPHAKSNDVSVDQVIQGARTRLVSGLNACDIKVKVPPIKLSKDFQSTCNICLKTSRSAMAF